MGLVREEMEQTLDKMETHTAPGAFRLISLVVEFAIEVLEDQGRQKVRTEGITHLLEHPEYRSLDKAKPLMNYAKVTARLSYFADSLTRMFGKELPPSDDSDK